jgi:hypothetical protein
MTDVLTGTMSGGGKSVCKGRMGTALVKIGLLITFNNISVISWRSVLLVEETGEPGENHKPVASH